MMWTHATTVPIPGTAKERHAATAGSQGLTVSDRDPGPRFRLRDRAVATLGKKRSSGRAECSARSDVRRAAHRSHIRFCSHNAQSHRSLLERRRVRHPAPPAFRRYSCCSRSRSTTQGRLTGETELISIHSGIASVPNRLGQGDSRY